MKKIICAIACSFLVSPVFAQSRTDYDAAVSRFQKFYNNHQADSLFAMCSEKIQTLSPLDKTTRMIEQVQAKLGTMNAYVFTSQKDGFVFYKTEFSNSTQSLVIALGKDNKLETFRFLPYKEDAEKKQESNFVLKTEKGNIYGTLSMPAVNTKVPVVLIIAGSGPTDRDGNQAGVTTNAYAMLADSLQRAGIACVRYDKRSVGESLAGVKREEDVSYDDLINDAAGFVNMLKADVRFSKVIVAGHSEGSLVGMMATVKAGAAAYISISGAGQRIDKIIEKQLAVKSKETAARATVIFDKLAKGILVKDVDSSLTFLLRPSVQPFLISCIKYDPVSEIKKLKAPVLILQGNTDIQVSVSDAKLLKKAAPAAHLVVIKGMSHILKDGPADRAQNIVTYSLPELPLNAEFVSETVKFIRSINS